MEPLHQFVIDLETFLAERGYEISSSQDIDLIETSTNRLIGYWPATVNNKSFQELK